MFSVCCTDLFTIPRTLILFLHSYPERLVNIIIQSNSVSTCMKNKSEVKSCIISKFTIIICC